MLDKRRAGMGWTDIGNSSCIKPWINQAFFPVIDRMATYAMLKSINNEQDSIIKVHKMKKNTLKKALLLLAGLILVACGSGSSENPDKTSKEMAIERIAEYAETNGTSMAPVMQDYEDISVIGIDNEEKLQDLNKLVASLSREDVDTQEKLQELVDGLNIVNSDTEKPVITRNGDAVIDLFVGDPYIDAGATAVDNIDGDITANIVVVNPVTTTLAGTYTITYAVSDIAGNAAERITRTVNVNRIKKVTEGIGANTDDGISGDMPNIKAFYIDPDGDDNADGLTPESAWRTLNNLKNKYFSAGEGVLFKRGGYWNGISTMPFQGARQGTASNPIVFSAYGTGARPIMDFTVTQTLTWILTENGVYSTPLTSAYRLRRMYVDGHEVLDATSYDELISHEKYMYWHDQDTELLYIQFNPVGKDIKYSTTNAFISFGSGSKYIIVSNLNIRGAKHSLRFPKTENVLIKNNNLGEGSHIGVSITGNNHVITNNTIDSVRPEFDYADSSSTAHGPHEAIAMKGSNSNAIVSHNTIRNWAHSSMASGGGSNMGLKFHNNYIDGSNLTYGTKFELFSGTEDVEVWKNYFYKTTRQQIGGKNIHIHHNIFDSMANTPLKPYNTGQAIGMYDFGAEASGSIIENNIFINSDGPALVFSSRGNYTGSHIIRNNIMYNNGKDAVTYPGDPKGIAIQIKNGSLSDSQFYNNLIYSDLSTKVMMTGNERTGPTYMVTEFDNTSLPDNNDGFDNLQADPLFKNVDELLLILDLSSPARGAGTAPQATKDWEENDIVAPYDIGIYNTVSYH